MKDENLKVHCLTKHNAAKRVAGEVSVAGFFASSSKRSKLSDDSSSVLVTDAEELLLESAGRKTPEDIFFFKTRHSYG